MLEKIRIPKSARLFVREHWRMSREEKGFSLTDRLPRIHTHRFLKAKAEALKQCDDLGLGFYGTEYPIFVKLTAFVPEGRKPPQITSAMKWTWDLLAGRLWAKRPRCVGFYCVIVRVKGERYMGTEIILERRDI